MRRRVSAISLILLATTVAWSSGCSGPEPTTAAGTAVGTVTVMAPAPMKAGLERAKVAFEESHEGATVIVNYGHVPALLMQISQGVPADILVTPDAETMARAQEDGVVGSDTVEVARNKLVLVVPADNPGQVSDLTALGNADLSVVVCAAELPCGPMADEVAARAGVTVSADSLEPGGSPAVVTKVAAGEADVGVCFVTDASAAADKVTVIDIDDEFGASVTVTAAAVDPPANAPGADQFLAFLSSPDGRSTFTEAGFAPL